MVDKAEELVKAIKLVQSGERDSKAGVFFLNYCKKTDNSKKYAETITRG